MPSSQDDAKKGKDNNNAVVKEGSGGASTSSGKTSSIVSNNAVATGAQSPAVNIAAEVLQEAAKGVKTENIENDHFDPCFFKNQIAMRQHDLELRPKATNRDDDIDPMTGDESNIIKVIAKESNYPNPDKLCYLTVRQDEHLGSGAFSDVFLGYVNKPNRPPVKVAIKKIWPDPSREDRQIGVHRCLNHINIVKLKYYFVCVHPRTKMTMWTLVMDVMPSTLAQEQSHYIAKGKIMPLLYIKLFTYQIFSALHHMEQLEIFHRDVKPENMLVCMDTGRLKIGDFGSAKNYKKGSKFSWYQVTRYYRAPELCMHFGNYDCTIDIWAAGCILAELLTNRIIFYGSNNDDQLSKILAICGTPTFQQLCACVPGTVVDERILKNHYPKADWYRIIKRYNKTMTAAAADFLTKVLRYERPLRLRGKEAQAHPFFDSLRNPEAKLPNKKPLPSLVGIERKKVISGEIIERKTKTTSIELGQ